MTEICPGLIIKPNLQLKIKLSISRIVSNQIILFQKGILDKCRMFFKKLWNFSTQKYYSKLARKLATNKINPKCFLPILKSFLNNKKTRCISPLIHTSFNQFVVDFKEKSELFNSFFAKQCTHIETGSGLPFQILRITNDSLNTINFTEDNILSVIKKLNLDKAHGHDK